ncbi:MAG: co-chaperone GroES family protein [Bacteroidota bacterium]
MPAMTMDHEIDPAQALWDSVGDVSKVEVFNNQLLVAVYIRPQKTKSGIYLTDKTTDEDRYQSKVGLVLKKGPMAFDDNTGQWFKDVEIEVGDWIVFRPSDGWSITVNNVLCRMIDDTNIKGRVDNPDRVW